MRRERSFFVAAGLALLVTAALVYIPGLHGPFVFDDLTNILQAPGIRIADLGYGSLLQAWNAREFDTLIGRPLAMLSFGLNYYFAEFDVFYFKLTNLIIHLAVGLALYALTLMLLRRYRLADANMPYQPRHLPWLALAIAAVWLLHPLNLTSVLYVVQRMTSLSALFTVLGLIGYCHGREQIIQGRKAGFATILVSLSLFGLLAVLCKENGVLVLPLAVLIEAAFYRLAAHPSLTVPFRRFWFAFIFLPLVIGFAVVLFQHERWFGENAYRFRDFTLEERLLTQARAIWFYLRLILLPDIAGMGLYHDDFPLSQGIVEPITTLLSVVGIVALVVAALVTRTRLPVLFFAIGWFFVGHSMESTVFPLEMIHEHRNYLPQYGILFAVVYFAGAPYARLKNTLRWRFAFLALYAALLGVGTYQRSFQWQDETSLYTREVINHPESARAHTMLGAWLHANGRREDALRHLTIASNLTVNKPDHLIRLVQHVYVTNRHVPEPMFEELRYRLMHGRVSGVTLWVYDPLLLVARDDPTWHDRFIELYAKTISQPDVKYSGKRYEAAYHLLAENHAYRGRFDVALEYYKRAHGLNPNPSYGIAIAKLYADNACSSKAEKWVSNVRTRHSDLAPAYQERLQNVEALLAALESDTSRCAL